MSTARRKPQCQRNKLSKLEEQEDLPNVMQQVSGGVQNRAVDIGYPSYEGQLVKPSPNQVHTLINMQLKKTKGLEKNI